MSTTEAKVEQTEASADKQGFVARILGIKKTAAHNIAVGIAATWTAVGHTAREIYRHKFVALVVVVALCVLSAVVWAAVWLLMVLPLAFWIIVVAVILVVAALIIRAVRQISTP